MDKPNAPEEAQPGDYVCCDCDRIERDPIFLDLETCSVCGELIEAIPDEDPDNIWRGAATPFCETY